MGNRKKRKDPQRNSGRGGNTFDDLRGTALAKGGGPGALAEQGHWEENAEPLSQGQKSQRKADGWGKLPTMEN